MLFELIWMLVLAVVHDVGIVGRVDDIDGFDCHDFLIKYGEYDDGGDHGGDVVAWRLSC